MTKVTSKNQGKEKSYQNGLVEAKKLHREHKEMRALVLAQSKPASMVRVTDLEWKYEVESHRPKRFLFFQRKYIVILFVFMMINLSLQKPPSYTKIRSNKPVGSIKALEVDTSNISPCECDPDSDHPCNQDSECLNRWVKIIKSFYVNTLQSLPDLTILSFCLLSALLNCFIVPNMHFCPGSYWWNVIQTFVQLVQNVKINVLRNVSIPA